jgi:hypothetical protein
VDLHYYHKTRFCEIQHAKSVAVSPKAASWERVDTVLKGETRPAIRALNEKPQRELPSAHPFAKNRN